MIYINLDSKNKVISASLAEKVSDLIIPLEKVPYDYFCDVVNDIFYDKSMDSFSKSASAYGIALTLKNAKADKESLVSNIVVSTFSDKIFDGDEKSQDRMVRAIQIASITGLTETQWKLANNEIVMVTLDELKEALALAGQEMSRIWLEQ